LMCIETNKFQIIIFKVVVSKTHKKSCSSGLTNSGDMCGGQVECILSWSQNRIPAEYPTSTL